MPRQRPRLERRAGQLVEVANELAEHYSRTKRTDKAVRYLALSGERSLRVYSLDEAESRFQHALRLIREAPACADDTLLVDLLLSTARVLYFRGDMKSIMGLVDGYLARVRALRRQAPAIAFPVRGRICARLCCPAGRKTAEAALALGEEIADEESIGYACLGLMWHYVYWAAPGAARRTAFREFGNRALAIGRKIGDPWLTSKALLAFANEAGVWGRVGEALSFDRQLLDLADQTGDPRPRGMGFYHLSLSAAYRDDFDTARRYAESALEASVSPVDRLFGRMGRAVALALGGEAQQARVLLEELRRETEESEFRLTGLFCTEIPYGVALIHAGKLAAGVRQIENAMERYAAWANPSPAVTVTWCSGRST